MAVTAKEFREVVRLVFLCIFWYGVSSSNGVLGKWILSEFPYPMTLTMVQLASIAVYSGPMLTILGIGNRCSSISWGYYCRAILPLALAKFISSVMTHFSIWKVPVSYAHTVKATMPMFTVALSRVLFGEKHSWSVYFSLVPILSGVAIATVTEVSFDIFGLGSALGATACFSVMNIFSKKVLKDTGIHHLRLLCTLGRIACFMFFPVWMFMDSFKVFETLTDSNSVSSSVLFLLFVDGVTYWLQNILAFTILKLVAPLTYAVANVTKRISIISVSILLIGNQVTASNVFGMLLAIFGVFYYNKVKYDENVANTTLPTRHTNSHSNPSALLKHQNGIANEMSGVRFSSVPQSNGKTTINGNYHHHSPFNGANTIYHGYNKRS